VPIGVKEELGWLTPLWQVDDTQEVAKKTAVDEVGRRPVVD